MAEKKDQNLLAKVPLNVNPYTPEGQAQYNEAYGVTDLQNKVKKVNKRIRNNVVRSAGFNDQFKRFLNRRKPVESEMATAAEAYQDIENPFVRRQLVNQSSDAIKQRRQNVAGDFAEVLSARLQAQQLAQQNRENALNRAITDRTAAQSFAGQQLLSDITYQRQKETEARAIEQQLDLAERQFRQQMALEKEFGVGSSGSSSGGGGGGDQITQGIDPYFKSMGDNVAVFDNNTGELVNMYEGPPSGFPTLNDYVGQKSAESGQSIDTSNPSTRLGLQKEYNQYLIDSGFKSDPKKTTTVNYTGIPPVTE